MTEGFVFRHPALIKYFLSVGGVALPVAIPSASKVQFSSAGYLHKAATERKPSWNIAIKVQFAVRTSQFLRSTTVQLTHIQKQLPREQLCLNWYLICDTLRNFNFDSTSTVTPVLSTKKQKRLAMRVSLHKPSPVSVLPATVVVVKHSFEAQCARRMP